jgi:hypothetical protein
LAAFLAVSLASSLIVLGDLQSAAIALADRNRPVAPRTLLAMLHPHDWLLAGLNVLLLPGLACMERARGALSLLVRAASPRQSFVVLTAAVAWLGQAYLFPGVLLGGDSGSHITRFFEIRTGLAAGTLPLWSNYDYLGSSLLGFTGPLFYIVGGTVDLLVRDPTVTAKILLFAAHLAAGWAFFALLRRFGMSRAAAMLAAIGFAGSFALLHLFVYRGEYPQAFTIVLLVLTFHAAEGLMRGPASVARNWLLFAVCVGALTLNHQPHALFVGFYLGLFGLSSLILRRWRRRRLWLPVTAGLVGIGLSLPAVLPIVAEADWVMIEPANGFFHWHWPSVTRLLHLLVWRNTLTGTGTDYWAYVGIVLSGLALVGGPAALRGRIGEPHRRLALCILPGLAASFFLANPVVRDIMFVVFFIGIFAGFGLEYIAGTARPHSRAMLWIAVALMADVGSTSLQPVARTDKGFLIEAGRYLARVAPNERMAAIDIRRDGTIHASIGPAGSPLSQYALVQRVSGVHNMAATRVHNYAVAILEMAADDLRRNGTVSPRVLTLLRLLNVTRIVCLTPTAAGCPRDFAQAAEEGPLGRVIHVQGAGPAVFSRHLVRLDPPQGLDKPMLWSDSFEAKPPDRRVGGVVTFLHRFADTMAASAAGDLASALPVRDLASWVPDVPDAAPWNVRVDRYRVSLEAVEFDIAADGPGYAQLAHPWYPGSEIRIGGHVVQPLQSAIGLAVVPLQAGVNRIEIHPVVTPVRRYSLLAACGMLGVALLGTALLAHRTRSRATTCGLSDELRA